ncbi:hypothetical protein VSR01_24805 [Actinacidiphila sp. DG2A-62]|uniref:hypothetical protein n=1 Tax=Actinacidiphila sp. DG2A-62 TaxID=3108821 RepID=UPI002DB56EB0|nr:hypothetical protein [Actinacidiphila sp. DG2A-62]MEC3996552.1 hypothetical protein [Actinacidiphila sp. DG2A-62]
MRSMPSTAHYLQEQIPKAYEVRLTVVDGRMFPARLDVFFECNPAGTWAWAENAAGLGIASAHADYLSEGTNGT